jgi:hypothetical protein
MPTPYWCVVPRKRKMITIKLLYHLRTQLEAIPPLYSVTRWRLRTEQPGFHFRQVRWSLHKNRGSASYARSTSGERESYTSDYSTEVTKEWGFISTRLCAVLPGRKILYMFHKYYFWQHVKQLVKNISHSMYDVRSSCYDKFNLKANVFCSCKFCTVRKICFESMTISDESIFNVCKQTAARKAPDNHPCS